MTFIRAKILILHITVKSNKTLWKQGICKTFAKTLMGFPWPNRCKALTVTVNPAKALGLKGWTTVASFYGFNSPGKSQFLYVQAPGEQTHATHFQENNAKEASQPWKERAGRPLPATTLSRAPSANIRSTKRSNVFRAWETRSPLYNTQHQPSLSISLWFMPHTRLGKIQPSASTDNCATGFRGSSLWTCFLTWSSSTTGKSLRKGWLRINGWHRVTKK